MKRTVYHVTPVGDNWRVKRAGAGRAAKVCENKRDAIAEAKDLAKRAPLGQVKVHRDDGVIQAEYTYGQDPKATRG